MNFSPELLSSSAGALECPAELNACLNAHGLYNSVQCVLRLSPEVHRKLAKLPNGIVSTGIDFEGIQAFSTFLHETLHWWQHIGSTTGLMLSLSYPAQAHANYTNLKRVLEAIGPKKSLLRWLETTRGEGGPDTPHGKANIVVNNHFDIEFFRVLVTNPLLAQQATQSSLFQCLGHSCEITYGNINLILGDTVGDHGGFIQHPREWGPVFDALSDAKEEGFYYGSPLRLSSVGAYQIFEGQARFNQLQYLHFAMGDQFGWDEARALGMLGKPYVEAFEYFLHFAKLPWPASIDDATVALFLLVCDIATNPGAGFPLPIRRFPSFVIDVDPGMRFLHLSWALSRKCADLRGAIRSYSRKEYFECSTGLCEAMIFDSPATILPALDKWSSENPAAISLLAERDTYDFRPMNLPVRFLFSHFLAFSRDKLAHPEWFCWPGAWMAGRRVNEGTKEAFFNHHAPYIDKADDGGIFPVLHPGRDEPAVYQTFNNFYGMNVTYDLIRQWIAKPGPFRFDYGWLSTRNTQAEFDEFGARGFEQLFGILPKDFEIL